MTKKSKMTYLRPKLVQRRIHHNAEKEIKVTAITPSLKTADETSPLKTLKNCRIVTQIIISKVHGIAKARNEGAKRAREGILFFVDDDVELTDEIISDVVSPVKQNTKSFVCLGSHPYDCCSRILCIRKSEFWKVGGFNERLKFNGEDFDFGQRAELQGYRKIMLPITTVKHKPHKRSLYKRVMTNLDQAYLLKKYRHKWLGRYPNYSYWLFFFDFRRPLRTLFHVIGFSLAMIP